MQEVFIRQLGEIAARLQGNEPAQWPVQFAVSTHSSHIANETPFSSIRYFIAGAKHQPVGVRSTAIKDLSKGLPDLTKTSEAFLHQYLTLTRCDLFFADKAIRVEGTTERILIPGILRKLDAARKAAGGKSEIRAQYITLLEVGGAYAYLFEPLIEFLELRTLIVTDLDAVHPVTTNGKTRLVKCPVYKSSQTSNATLKKWFGKHPAPAALIAKPDADKIRDHVRIAYQHPEAAGAICGRTFEDAFIFANPIDRDARELLRRRQQIACITYTRVARDMILTSTDRNPVVYCETTHAFAWNLMRQFQKQVRDAVQGLEVWAERLAEAGDIEQLGVDYELGQRRIEDGRLSLHHDDIFPVLIRLLDNAKFRSVLTSRFPVILVDEYQDTDADLIAALEKHFFGVEGAPQFGFYGDHWQKIYGDGIGTIDHPALARIDKGANFRSVKPVVDGLNRIRPELPQIERDANLPGMIRIFHTNGWGGKRQTRNHWRGDLPADEARAAFIDTRAALENAGWDFAPEHTKVLMLTQRALANELGYGSLPGVFRFNDAFARKSDPHIAWFVDQLEPAALAFEVRRYGEMFEALGRRAPPVRGAQDKQRWSQTMARILEIRAHGTAGDMMAHLLETGLPELPEDVAKAERRLAAPLAEGEERSRRLDELEKLKAVPFTEITELARYHAGTSPFETKHGVKGDQFDNVLGVFGRGWNDYNFDDYLRFARNPGAAANPAAFERACNLFYVVCSRPKERLSLLFTQKLSDDSLATLTDFFGAGALIDIGGQL